MVKQEKREKKQSFDSFEITLKGCNFFIFYFSKKNIPLDSA